MKITKILVALAFLFGVSTANAGELTVTGNMETTYHTSSETTTGNPLGMDRELKFAGSTELDNGITVSVFQDTSDSLAFGNTHIEFGNIGGVATIYVGSDKDPVDAIDDVTPSAYEEANGSGSGTGYVDVGGLAGETGIGVKFSLPFLGAVDARYVPKADGSEAADNANSNDAAHSVGSGKSISIKPDLASIPGISGTLLEGLSIVGGAEEEDVAGTTNAALTERSGATVAVNYATGPFKVGFQKKVVNQGEVATGSDDVEYLDTIIGIAYAVNDSLSVSYNRYESKKGDDTSVQNYIQETDAINVGYTVGGMTIGFQDASTDNANYTTATKDDTRTLGISVAF
jgi:hypothetical protein